MTKLVGNSVDASAIYAALGKLSRCEKSPQLSLSVEDALRSVLGKNLDVPVRKNFETELLAKLLEEVQYLREKIQEQRKVIEQLKEQNYQKALAESEKKKPWYRRIFNA